MRTKVTASPRPKHYRAIADYYDAENARHAMLEQDVPFFLRQLPRRAKPGRRVTVLELGVGTGRAAIPMAQAGHAVVGVDYDAAMLELAARKRDAVGLGGRDLALVESDLLELDLGRRFDWVCVFFNTFLSFTTLEQQDRVLQSVRRHLKPGGGFWVDVFQPNLELLARGSSRDLEPHAFYVPHLNRTVFQATHIEVDAARQLQRVTFEYAWFEPDGRERRRRREFDLTFLFERELRILASRNGLRVEQTFGDYDGSPPSSESPRLMARCCRA